MDQDVPGSREFMRSTRTARGTPCGMATTRRPNPGQWLRYAFGAGLPDQYRDWVVHDVTARTWLLRHVARALVQIAPVAVAIYLLLPFDPVIRLSAVLFGAAFGLFYSAVFAEAMTEHRIVKAGYPEGTAAQLRRERRAHSG